MRTAVTRSIDLPADPATVWHTLTDGEELSAWFAAEVHIDPHPGGQVLVRDEGQRRRAVIVHFEPERQLTFRWLPERRPVGFVWPADDAPAGEGGEVTFTLEPVDGGTRLTVEETAPDRGARPIEANIRAISLPASYVVALGGRTLQVCA